MNLIVLERKSDNAQSASDLLKKYAQNKNCNECFAVSFLEDMNCRGDGYRVEIKEKEIFVYANTAVGFNAAVGYLIRHQETEIKNQTVTFESDFRAVYFANHFYNYYHSAPAEELCEYLESLALWGQSALCLWFDMHHFEAISTPDAEQMLQKMICLFKKAKSLGMKIALTHLSNEYYVGATQELLAENTVESGKYTNKLCGYYYTELCPSRQDGEKLLLDSFDALMSRFSSVGLNYVMLWPYDQGGCTCDACFPWGAGGHYRISKKKAEIAKKHFPNIEIIFSCWRFDHFTSGEWDAVLSLFQTDGEWIDRIMVDIHDNLPDALYSINKPIVSFPEISMYHCTPWGGFGANPFPKALAAQFQKTKSLCHGGALYSEGIFEDINKAVALEQMRDPGISPEQTVLQYCSYHFGACHAEKMVKLIFRLEKTLHRRTYLADGSCNDYPAGKISTLHRYEIENTEEIDAIFRDAVAIYEAIPEEIRLSWRFKQIFARACADAALLKNGGIPSEESDTILEELIPIYHAQKAYYFVSPVTRESVLKNRGDGV